MQAFCNLAEALCIHTSFIVLLELLYSGLHLRLKLLFATSKLFGVYYDLVLLIDHFSFKLADLALENLHFLSPRKALTLNFYLCIFWDV